MRSRSKAVKAKKLPEPRPQRPHKLLGIRLAALVEMVLMFAVMLIVGDALGASHRLITVSPHPFWIVVLLISVQYGCVEGIIACVLATLCLYVGNVPPQEFRETLFDYQVRLAALPFMWFVAAFVLGEMRLRVDSQKEELADQLDNLTEEATTIFAAYEKLKDTKEQQDRLLASQQQTAASIYQTFKYLQSLAPTRILLDLDKIFATALDPRKFSVYAVGPNGLEVATSHGWQDNDTFMRRIPTSHPLFKAIAEERRLVAIINPLDQTILQGQGMLAAPLIDPENNHLLGMVKIEDMEFLDFNRNTLQAFQALCEVIGLAYAHARRFRALDRQAIFAPEAPIYSSAFLAQQKPYMEELSRRARLPLTLIHVRGFEEQQDQVHELTMGELLKSAVQPLGMVFKASRKPLDFVILLPNTDKAAAEALSGEILEATQRDKLLSMVKLSQKVEILNNPISVGAKRS